MGGGHDKRQDQSFALKRSAGQVTGGDRQLIRGYLSSGQSVAAFLPPVPSPLRTIAEKHAKSGEPQR